MRQFYIILFILTFSNVFAQKIPWKTGIKPSTSTKYVHVFDPYNDGDEEYFFDKEGKLEKYISISRSIIDLEQVFRSQFVYNGDVLIRKENFYNDRLSYIIEYSYEEGNLVLETEIDVEKALIWRQKSYCYSDGKLSSKLVVASDGIDVTEINYTNDGSVTETREYYGEEQLQRLITVIEDKNSAIEEICSYGGYNGVWKQIRKFIYDDNKNILEASVHDDEANQTQRFVYIDNKITNAKYYDSKDGLWMEEFYDNHGNIVKEERPDTESQNKGITLFENYYNKKGDLVKVKRNKGRTWMKKIKIKYYKS